MSLLDAIYCDYSECCDDFKNGITYLKSRLFFQAAESFCLAYESVAESDRYYNIYMSYLGVSKLMHGDFAAIELCRMAINNEWNNADVFLNLARAELFCKNRLNTVRAIEQGFDIDRAHAGLNVLHKKIGMRRRNVIPFLSRKNAANQYVGRFLRKNRRI